MPINKNFKSTEEARNYIKTTSKTINPSNATLKFHRLTILVGNKPDYEILNTALTGMHNVKWIKIKLEGPKNDLSQ
tara:strand:- start:997 stop:1224 length:228 start_codon:yes stop_codon:yes gene_type:complete